MKAVFFFVLSFVSLVISGQDISQLRKSEFNLEKGIAIRGYDPVSYFRQGKPMKGKKGLAVFVQGVTYYFASADNKQEFKKKFL
jgi:YHS domain-containing protein